MRYGEGLLEEILRRTDLVKLVGRRVKLARKGRVFWGLCPFHKEKSPSFKVENERRNYHCFGCGAGGERLQMAAGNRRPELPGSRAAPGGGSRRRASRLDAGRRSAREPRRKSLYDIIELACAFFEDAAERARRRRGARAICKARGLDSAGARSASAWAMRPTATAR